MRRPSSARGAAAAWATLALLAAIAIGACGGGDVVVQEQGDVEGLLDRAFRQPVRSADVDFHAQLQIEGGKGLERPVRLEGSGPYIAGAGSLPRLDVDLEIGVQGAGQAVEAGFLSAGDRAFVKFGGKYYEQPRKYVERANRELRRRSRPGGAGSLRDLGLAPRSWVIEAREEGGEEVAGVQTRHLSGKLDVRAMLADLYELLERSSAAFGGAGPALPGQLSEGDLDRLAKAVHNPSVDVYVASGDGTVRRVSASLEFVVPTPERARFGGLEGGSVSFSVELGEVNGDQRVEVPHEVRPIADLARQLGGLDALLGDLGGEALQERPEGAPGSPGDRRPQTPGEGRAEEATPEPDALQRYSQCLDKTPPDDTAGLTRCAQLLR